ncbi:VSP [Hexamita inflata]|uniref:VSP n=1 Tax=Hexamita inflata TaxID=28002 RepID=A0AA86RJB5_9EUKA|nr:VSP [Hexamita inflata]
MIFTVYLLQNIVDNNTNNLSSDKQHDMYQKRATFNYMCGLFMRPNPADRSQCICLDSSFEIDSSNSSQCKCKVGTYYNTYFKGCKKCSNLAVDYSNSFCICQSVLQYYNHKLQQCQNCPSGSTKVTSTNQCQCDSSSFFDGENQICSACPSGSMQSSNYISCSCTDQNLVQTQTGCVSCPSNAVKYDNICGCRNSPNKWYYQNNSCSQCPDSSNTQSNTQGAPKNLCLCITQGQALINGVCTTCPTSVSYVSVDTLQCFCNQVNQIFNNTSKTCVSCSSNSYSSNNKCFCNSNSYIVTAGVVPVCRLCPVNATSNDDQSTCVCPGGQTYNSGSNICIVSCTANEILDSGTNTCKCNSQSINVAGSCQPCPGGSTPIAGQNLCSCPALNIFVTSSMRCQPCPTNAFVENNVCKCPTNNFISSNICTPCPDGATSSVPYSTCICPNSGNFVLSPLQCITCPANSYLNLSTLICICSGNMYMKNDICVSCPSDATSNSDKITCTCNFNNYRFDSTSNQCVACPTNAFPDSNQKCICQAANSYVLNNVCTPCTANSKPTIDQTSCTCDSIYINVSGVCKQCPAGSGPVAGQLLCTCPQNNQIFDTQSMTCQPCPTFATVVSNQCVCPNNFYVKLGVCETCPPHATSVAPYSTCTCPNSETFVPSLGICKTCPLDSTLNLVTGVCTCNGNRFMKEGVCVACPSDSVNNSDKTSCTCNLNNYRFDSASAKCLACPSGAFPDSNQVCVCQTANGFVLSGVCTPCPAASSPSSDLASCICTFSTQFFKVDQKACLPCPAGGTASSAGNSCICGSDQYVVNNTCTTCVGQAALKEDKSTCVCTLNTQYFSSIDNVCLNCPSGATTSPGGVCLCPNANDFMTPAACVPCPMYTSPSSDRTYCICSWNDYFDRDSVSCISCWAHSTVLNNICICDSGYFKSASKCAACPIGSQVTGDGLSCSCSNGLGFDPLRVLCYSCPAGTSLSQNACLCSGSQYYFSGSCLSCPSGASLKVDKSSCACTDASKFFDAKSNSCRSCPDSSASNGNGQCLCPGDSFLRNEVCFKCPSGTQPNSLKTSCVCVDNQVFNSSSLTCSACLYGATNFNDRCVCDFGFQQIGSVCALCPTSSLPSFSTIQSCTCTVPQFMSEDRTKCQVDDLAAKCSKFIIRRGTKMQYCLDGKTFNNYELDKNIYFDQIEGLHASVFHSVQKMKNVKLNIKSHFNDFITQISLSHYMNASIVSCNISIQAKGNEGSALALSGSVSLNSCQIHFKLDGMVNGLVYNAETIVMNKSSILVECMDPEYYNSKLLADTASSIRVFDSRLIGVNIKYPFSTCPVAIITRSCVSGLGECQSTCTGVGECS